MEKTKANCLPLSEDGRKARLRVGVEVFAFHVTGGGYQGGIVTDMNKKGCTIRPELPDKEFTEQWKNVWICTDGPAELTA
ncbi:MAG: hypothetical protein ACYTF1_19495 [Planctomycetota bacterium]